MKKIALAAGLTLLAAVIVAFPAAAGGGGSSEVNPGGDRRRRQLRMSGHRLHEHPGGRDRFAGGLEDPGLPRHLQRAGRDQQAVDDRRRLIKIENNAVRNIALGPGLEDCQSGQGIFVQSGTETGVEAKSKVEIDGNTVHDYQKTGIIANEDGTDASIHDNPVTGIGSTNLIAQNGIQLAFGAKGEVAKNSVINHVYGQCTSTTVCPFTSSNILLYGAVAPNVHDNEVGNSQVNIYQGGDKGKVNNNTIYQSVVFDGIDLVGDDNDADNNTINDSDDSGVYVQGAHNHVEGNTINEASTGIFEDTPSSDNHYGGNHFWNVVTMFQPATIAPHAATLNTA